MHVLFHQRMKARTAIMDAATECQWTPTEPPSSIFRSDYYLLKDLRSNYEDTFKLGANIKFVGPMYPKTRQITADEEEIVQEFLLLEVARKLFVTMGSSGAKEYFIEAVKAIGELGIPALVALAPGRCSIKDIESAIGAVPHHVFLTEKFVPADVVASQVDVVISHGGQGTVQTALGSGTPIVGVGMQWEQQFNLDNAARQGAAVRIDKRKWNSYSIQEAVTEVLDHESYSQSAKRIQKEIVKTNSADTAARFILDIAQSR
jgi:UDP:flavonoid glycosyltransferase YjiC (YdhE family)